MERAAARSSSAPLSCAGVGYTIAHKHELWWSPRDPEQSPLWSSLVILSTEFYDELVTHAVPIDLRVVHHRATGSRIGEAGTS